MRSLTDLKAMYEGMLLDGINYTDIKAFIETVIENANADIVANKVTEYAYILEDYKSYDYVNSLVGGGIREELVNDFIECYFDNGINHLADSDFENWDKLFNTVFSF
jgi:hypothetical protein